MGSSLMGVGSWGEAACDEEHAEAVVVLVVEAWGDAAVEFDESVDGLGAAGVRPAGGEVAQELAVPPVQGRAEALDLGDRAGREDREDLLGDSSARGLAWPRGVGRDGHDRDDRSCDGRGY